MDIDKLFKAYEKEVHKNANELYKMYGDSEEYALQRMDSYEVGDKFKFDGLKYEVLKIEREKELITFKRLGFTFRRAPSGRKLKRYGKFGITSTMDLTLEFIK